MKEYGFDAIDQVGDQVFDNIANILVNDGETLGGGLRSNYVDIESWMEELARDGEYQGGSIDILMPENVADGMLFSS